MKLTEQITTFSPWWANEKWDETDKDIAGMLKSGIKFRQLAKFKISIPSVEIIRGPRQVGKTTEIKIIIRDLLNKGFSPQSVAYFNCDIVPKFGDLFDILKTFSEHLKINNLKQGFIFLDEISSVKDWQRAVKAFVDAGLSGNIQIVVTGSSAIELKRGYERMPGRRNGGRDYIFLPLDFRAFCSQFEKGKNIPEVRIRDLFGSRKTFEKLKEALLPLSGALAGYLTDYAGTGGFPRSVSDLVKKKGITDETLVIYRAVLFSEFEKYKKNINILLQLLLEITAGLTVPVSYNSLMKRVELASAGTVREYVEMLEDAYLGVEVPCLDISRKRRFAKKDKKIYFIDPVLYKLLNEVFKTGLPETGKIIENLAGIKLARCFMEEWARTGSLDGLYYWKSSKGNEVDFVIYEGGKPFGIEVKYQNQISGWDEMGIKKGIGRGIVVTKDVFEFGEIPKIPAWLFLLLDW